MYPRDDAPDTEIPRLLSFLFLAFCTVTDGDLAPEELEVMAGRIKRWIPDGAHTHIVEFVEQAAALYDAHESDRSVWSSASDFARLLRGRITQAQRRDVIEDLIVIAKADGVIVAGEIEFIEHIMRLLAIKAPHGLREGPVEPEFERTASLTNMQIAAILDLDEL
ncbi:MAG: TerB family tellurite resistance protein [Myxococcales bacterium]|nr:TerB family tellurite resistance protein [Myxococcales bacterium]MCB9749996.1 TerB family tellurite resistance protein [Myxococcales bacterium]